MSLQVAVGSVALGLLIGVPSGMLAGYFATTWVDEVIVRAVDIILALPLFILGLVVLGFTGAGPINVLGLELPPVTKCDRADRGRGRSDVRPRGACQRADRTPGGLRRPRSESSASGGGGSCSATSSSTSFPQSSYKPRRGWRWRCSPRPVSASSVSVSSLLSRPSGTSCSRRRARSCSVTGGSRMFAGLLIFTVIAGFNLIGDGIGRAFGRDTGA